MNTQIKKFGNSLGIIITTNIVNSLNLKVGDQLDIVVVDNKMILNKSFGFNPSSLDELFENFEGDYKEEIIFEENKGNEI